MENYALVNMLLCSNHFTEVHYVYFGTQLKKFSLPFPCLFRRLFRTAIFSRFSKVAIATTNFINEFYNGGFSPEFSVSMLKEIIALV